MIELLNSLNIPFAKASLAEYTGFKTGGEALIASPASPGALCQLLGQCSAQNIPFLVWGRGSNILAPDEGCSALIISTQNLQGLQMSRNTITALCGVSLKSLSSFAAQHGLGGLEFACGIPGSVGGALYMNAGAYGGEISMVLESAEAFDTRSLQTLSLPVSACAFGYRQSLFQTQPYVVLSASFTLNPLPKKDIETHMASLAKQREDKQPLEYPSAGSTFKRPEGHFAGKLIADAGLQGFNINGAEVSTKHAGFIINRGGARSADILKLIAHIQKTVHQKFGVALHPEVRILRPDGSFQN